MANNGAMLNPKHVFGGFIAGEDLPANRFVTIKGDASGNAVVMLPTDGSVIIGATLSAAKKGAAADIATAGIVQVETSEEFNVGSKVRSDTVGMVRGGAAGANNNNITGIALSGASQEGVLVSVLLMSIGQ